jgi:integrase
VDLEAGTLTVREKLLRKTWQHGCDGTCPPRKRGGLCPQRYGGGLVFEPPKSRTSERTVSLPGPVWQALRDHREAQAVERELAGSKWIEHGLVFTAPFGGPVDPSKDWAEWKTILAAAGVADARLHDARHTASTFLLMQGVTGRDAMALMGWSQESLVKRYQHPVEQMKRDAAALVADLLWPVVAESSATTLLPEPDAKILPFRPKAV